MGSVGGGEASRFFRIGYRLISGAAIGCSFSLVTFGLPRRSRELSVVLGVDEGASMPAALRRRSSASLASLEEPPRSRMRGRNGSLGSRVPTMWSGMSVQGVSRNQSPAESMGNSAPSNGPMVRAPVLSRRENSDDRFCACPVDATYFMWCF